MDAEFAKIQFKSLMVIVRHLSENADADLAQTMHRELEREIGVLTPKFRRSKDSAVVNSDTVLQSGSAG